MITISGLKKYYNKVRGLLGILKVGASDPKDDDLTQPVIMPFKNNKIAKHHACALAWNTGL